MTEDEHSAIMIQAGAPGELTPYHAELTGLATLLALAAYPGAMVEWWVHGYDDDPRSLWEIPEVAAHIRACAIRAGFIDGFDLPDALGPTAIVLLTQCGCFPNGHKFNVTITEHLGGVAAKGDTADEAAEAYRHKREAFLRDQKED